MSFIKKSFVLLNAFKQRDRYYRDRIDERNKNKKKLNTHIQTPHRNPFCNFLFYFICASVFNAIVLCFTLSFAVCSFFFTHTETFTHKIFLFHSADAVLVFASLFVIVVAIAVCRVFMCVYIHSFILSGSLTKNLNFYFAHIRTQSDRSMHIHIHLSSLYVPVHKINFFLLFYHLVVSSALLL